MTNSSSLFLSIELNKRKGNHNPIESETEGKNEKRQWKHLRKKEDKIKKKDMPVLTVVDNETWP